MKNIRTLICFLMIFSSAEIFAQTDPEYSDQLLSSSFKLYHEADFELSYHLFPFIKERFLEHLADSSSFSNPYSQLSEHLDIRISADGLLKTYSWEQRDSGCCPSTEIYAQFKIRSGRIRYVNLKDLQQGDEEIFTTDLQLIQINKKPYYLILGYGTCCGGKHYGKVNVYEIKNDNLYRCDLVFNDQAEIYAGANRGQKIALKYDPVSKILSYNSYGEITDSGFYGPKKTEVKWQLKETGFEETPTTQVKK